MTHENFCYWLQGYFELNGVSELRSQQVEVIKEHLQLCFEKKTGSAKKVLDTQFPYHWGNPASVIGPTLPQCESRFTETKLEDLSFCCQRGLAPAPPLPNIVNEPKPFAKIINNCQGSC